MATTRLPRPGRPLAALALLLVVLAGGMLISGAVKPRLAVDLAGGTSVTLTARPESGTTGGVTAEAMNQAVAIIRQRVNSTGVTEAEVAVRGGDQIVVTVPGQNNQQLVELVGQTALLRFRPVLAAGPPTPLAASDATSLVSAVDSIPQQVVDGFAALDCTAATSRQGGDESKPGDAVVACDREGTAKYILGPAAVEGTSLTAAEAGLPRATTGGGWQVNLSFDSTGAQQFAQVTGDVVNLPDPRNEVAIVLDGLVISAPRILEPIAGGQAEITGTFTQSEATDLAHVLQYGALPLAFDQSQVSTISPTLGADQLNAGLLAGAIGLGLVVLYGLAYYRRLGVIAVASLAVAGAVAYFTVSLLGATMNYRLSLAGMAGIIVAVGITADSFVVFFERLRDELREGRTLRTAVEYGWRRARRTIIVADTVSFLAAAVLYLFSADQVKGFAFTLGLMTLIDLAVVFLFTKPLVTLAARSRLLQGSRSGVDPASLGTVTGGSKRRLAGLGARLYRGEASIDFVGRWRRWFAISGVALVLMVVTLVGGGLDLGVEFQGGAVFEARSGTATVADVRDAVEAQVAEPQVRELANGNLLVEIGQVSAGQAAKVQEAVAGAVGMAPEDVKTDVIGPSWGGDVTHKALLSLGVFLTLVVIYLSIAFEPIMAASAVVALLHDVLITVGVYAIIGFTVTPATVVGVLTILGYSLYDTVVVFDKVKENTRGITGAAAYGRAANLAVNQTLLRSINTSVIALLPVTGILIVGVGLVGTGTLQDLSLALLVGIASGTYSSLFVAVPLLARLKDWAQARSVSGPVKTPRKRTQARVPELYEGRPMPEWDIDQATELEAQRSRRRTQPRL